MSSVQSSSARGFEQAQLKLFCAGKWDRIALGKTGRTVLIGRPRGGFQHAVKAEIRQTVGRDVLADFFRRVIGGNKLLFRRRVDSVKTGRDDRR